MEESVSIATTGGGESAPPPAAPAESAPAPQTETAPVTTERGWQQWANEPALPSEAPPQSIKDKYGKSQMNPAWVDYTAQQMRTKAAEPQQRDQLKALSRYGSYEEVSESLAVVADLLDTKSATGVSHFLHSLREVSPARYDQMVDTIIDSDPQTAVEKLMLSGYLPSALIAPQAEVGDEELRWIPEALHSTYLSLHPQVRGHLWEKSASARQLFLEQEQKLQEQYDELQRNAEQNYMQRWNEATAAGQKSVDTLSSQFEREHYETIEKAWKPTKDKAANQKMYTAIIQGALSDLMADDKFSAMYDQAYTYLTQAPLLRLTGKAEIAQRGEIQARQLARQFNTRLGQLVRERVEIMKWASVAAAQKTVSERGQLYLPGAFLYDLAYTDGEHNYEVLVRDETGKEVAWKDFAARTWTEIKKDDETPTKHDYSKIPGAPPTLDPKTGRTSQKYLDWIVKNLPKSKEASRAQTLNDRRDTTG